jgi:hypothetical protein
MLCLWEFQNRSTFILDNLWRGLTTAVKQRLRWSETILEETLFGQP